MVTLLILAVLIADSPCFAESNVGTEERLLPILVTKNMTIPCFDIAAGLDEAPNGFSDDVIKFLENEFEKHEDFQLPVTFSTSLSYEFVVAVALERVYELWAEYLFHVKDFIADVFPTEGQWPEESRFDRIWFNNTFIKGSFLKLVTLIPNSRPFGEFEGIGDEHSFSNNIDEVKQFFADLFDYLYPTLAFDAIGILHYYLGIDDVPLSSYSSFSQDISHSWRINITYEIETILETVPNSPFITRNFYEIAPSPKRQYSTVCQSIQNTLLFAESESALDEFSQKLYQSWHLITWSFASTGTGNAYYKLDSSMFKVLFYEE